MLDVEIGSLQLEDRGFSRKAGSGGSGRNVVIIAMSFQKDEKVGCHEDSIRTQW